MPRRPARDDAGGSCDTGGEAPAASIRSMGPGDVDFALQLTAREGWGFVRKDFSRLLALTPGGSHIALVNGRRVGILTTIRHRESCWIGNVVVAPSFRRSGIGRRLVIAALEHAGTLGIRRVGLISRAGTVGFYYALGFSKGPRIIGMGGIPALTADMGPDEEIIPVSRELLPEVIRLDKECACDDRGPMLASFMRDFGRHFLVHLKKGEVDGFIVGKPGAQRLEIGPWTISRGDRKAAGALFAALVSKRPGPVEVYIPEGERWALGFLEASGLKKENRFVEMIIGGRRKRSEKVQALAPAGLEKG